MYVLYLSQLKEGIQKKETNNFAFLAEPYIGAHTHAHPCPWVLGGHGCDVIVHGWAWVGMGVILLFMDGHGFCASLHPTPNRSQTSRMQSIR
jgi:hypothetical protein